MIQVPLNGSKSLNLASKPVQHGSKLTLVRDNYSALEVTMHTIFPTSIVAGGPANFTIPSNIASGDYLLRSELISLQLAVSVGGAEFYPACIQLSIGGSGTGAPQSSEVCKFPGCYSDTDPGIYDPNASNIYQALS